MKKARNVVLALLCALLLIVGSVAGTLAYLTSLTGTVTNTFTVGNVKITLDETKVDEYGVAVTPAARTQENTYKLIPNHTYVKDPTIHVDAESEDCWLFVKITDDIATIQDADTIATQLAANGWTAVAGETGVYAYKETASKGEDIPVFANFKIKADADVAGFAGKTITVIAYAVQADGFNSAAEAWADASTNWTQPTP